MWVKIFLLLLMAGIPFAVFTRYPFDDAYKWFPGGAIFFFFLCGFAWCILYANTLYRADPARMRVLLWLAPLALFAFAWPAWFLWLGIGFAWAGWTGQAIA